MPTGSASFVTVLLIGSVLGQCGDAKQPTGAVALTAALSDGVDDHITKMILTIDGGPAGFAPVRQHLDPGTAASAGRWTGIVPLLPTGSYDFRLDAFDGDKLIYTGDAHPVIIRAGQPTVVNEVLEPAPGNRPPPFENVAPSITELVLSSDTVPAGDSITLRVKAVAGQSGSLPLTYVFGGGDGTFTPQSQQSSSPLPVTFIWTAPSVIPGPEKTEAETLTVQVTDQKGNSAMQKCRVTVH